MTQDNNQVREQQQLNEVDISLGNHIGIKLEGRGAIEVSSNVCSLIDLYGIIQTIRDDFFKSNGENKTKSEGYG